MSELLSDEDDPDPLSGKEYLPHGPFDEPYNGAAAENTLLAEMLERENVQHLSSVASHLLERHPLTYGDPDDRILATSSALLRRRVTDSGQNTYFFVVSGNELRYCRSWSNTSDRVNFCIVEQRYEPADEVRQKLEAAFPLAEEVRARWFGAGVLAKLRRAG